MRFTKTVPYKLKRLVPMLGLAGATMFTACDKEIEPVIDNKPKVEPHYNVELFFNNENADQIDLDTIKKYDANKLVDTIFMIPNDNNSPFGAYEGYGPNALHNVRMFLEKRIDASPKVRGKGEFILSKDCVFPADSLWFVQQGWTIRQR